MPEHKFPDYDGEPLKLVGDAYSISRDSQTVRNEQYKRDHKLYNSFMDMSDRDPDRANIFIPKIFSIVETKAPRDVKALLGIRPYIPFDSRRQEFRDISKIQTTLLDEYLYMGGFFEKTMSGGKIKILYGTSFMEATPYYEQILQKQLVPDVVMGQTVGVSIQETPVFRMRLKIKEYAPWELFVDPFATNLEEKGNCRYVIKVSLVSKREIMKLAQKGAYPGFDLDKLNLDQSHYAEMEENQWGLLMLRELGLPTPTQDNDLGVLLRYESEERYIDVWNGQAVLRDIPNPYKHGMINLTRWVHMTDAHPQNKFWGIGEAKPNEILQAMLNDTWNITFDNHNMMNQGMTYYRKGAVNPDALVRTVGNKIAIDSHGDRPIGHDIQESFGEPLPSDHYIIAQNVERMMDLTSGVWNIQRGESDNTEKTLGEASMLKEGGDVRQELNIRLGEHIFLADFGRKCLSHIDQFAMVDDVVEIVGEEEASKMYAVNPSDLPGGFNFTFKGSDRVANLLIKQRNMKELTPLVMQSPNVSQAWWLRKLLEAHELQGLDLDEGIYPDEIALLLQQATEQRDFERQLLLAQVGKSQQQSRPGQSNRMPQPEKKTATSVGSEATKAGQENNII